ncbi:unnamed protein product [Nippostrongylus brasiliensis]|uniref:Secreted protein n=1 Tax=Nippostrongylus brasiliensis TaxID=27835 RepID=A0A0N4XSW2_NIPBR|nr:unnamed protein product [Nippostrongylus brasiliensis]
MVVLVVVVMVMVWWCMAALCQQAFNSYRGKVNFDQRANSSVTLHCKEVVVVTTTPPDREVHQMWLTVVSIAREFVTGNRYKLR